MLYHLIRTVKLLGIRKESMLHGISECDRLLSDKFAWDFLISEGIHFRRRYFCQNVEGWHVLLILDNKDMCQVTPNYQHGEKRVVAGRVPLLLQLDFEVELAGKFATVVLEQPNRHI